MCSISHYGNINKDTATYQYICVPVTTYYPTVIALSYQLCHQGITCEWLLTNLIPAVAGHYCRQVHVNGRILYLYICIYIYTYNICVHVYMYVCIQIWIYYMSNFYLFSIVVGEMKMGNTVPRAGIEPMSLEFQASVLS